VFDRLEGRLQAFDEAQATRAETGAAAIFEKGAAQLGIQGGDEVGNRRRGDSEAPGRARVALGPVHFQEHAQGFEAGPFKHEINSTFAMIAHYRSQPTQA